MTNERPFHEQYEVRASNGNQALEDLTAARARARIAELESRLAELVDCGQDGPVCAVKAPGCLAHNVDYQRELRARITELEDWQRRAVGTGLLDEHNGCQCRTCRDVTQLLSEVKP